MGFGTYIHAVVVMGVGRGARGVPAAAEVDARMERSRRRGGSMVGVERWCVGSFSFFPFLLKKIVELN